MQTANVATRLPRLLAMALLVAASVRIVASTASGIATLASPHEGFPSGERAGEILSAFGSAGDTVQVLLLVAALVLTWRGIAGVAAAHSASISVLAVVTIVLVACRAAGTVVITSDFAVRAAAAQQSLAIGFGLADIVIAGAVISGTRLLARAEQREASEVDEPVVFAVDRGNGEVFAFFSYAETRRTLSIYSIEDGEFDFYSDEGFVIRAVVESERVHFSVTEDNRREQLMSALRRFAAAHDLAVDSDDDATAYAVPISDWQWLELWPGWMRGLGRLVNRVRR